MNFLRIERLKKVYATVGLLIAIFLAGGVLSGIYVRGTSIYLECVVDGEPREFILRGGELLTGVAVLRCEEKGGERLCGPLTQGKIPIYLYVPPTLDRMYFAPKLEDTSREKCHSLNLGYSPRFNMCVSMDNVIECRKKSF